MNIFHVTLKTIGCHEVLLGACLSEAEVATKDTRTLVMIVQAVRMMIVRRRDVPNTAAPLRARADMLHAVVLEVQCEEGAVYDKVTLRAHARRVNATPMDVEVIRSVIVTVTHLA